MGECDFAGLFKDIEHRNPILSRRFHADLRAVQFRQPTTKVSKTFGEGGKPGFMVIGSIVTVSDANTSINPGLVNVETAAVIQDDFEHGVPPAKYLQGQQGLVVRKIESISKR